MTSADTAARHDILLGSLLFAKSDKRSVSYKGPSAVCRSLNADVDRGVKRCSGVGKAGAVSIFKRYFST